MALYMSLNTFLLLFFAFVPNEAKELHPLSNEYIDLINSKQSSWKAGRNFHPDTSMDYIKGLMGLIEDSRRSNDDITIKHHDEDLINSLPESFDPRVKWPNCPSLNEIRDQGGCGSCWAIAAVEAMTDRYCIFSSGTKQFHFSTEDLLTCSNAGSCKGGGWGGWRYWKESGIVSGGLYNSNEGCRPYALPPCEHHTDGSGKECHEEATPICERSCISSYGVDYSKDKRFGGNIKKFDTEDDIKAELFRNGPIEVGFTVYPDFLIYKTGVYKHIDGKEAVGGHAVKMLGWGVENGTKYWLVANSWNPHWGDKGFFKILRGENHCGVESDGVASDPIII